MSSKFNFNLVTSLGCRRVAPLLFAQSHNAPLSPRDAARLNAHLQTCVSCQKEAAELAAVEKMLRANIPAAPLPASDLWSRIEAEIAPQNQNAPFPLSRRPMLHRAPFALGGMAWAGSCAIVLVWGGWMTFGSGLLGRLHPTAHRSAAGMASTASLPATVTIIPPSPLAAAAQQTKQESVPLHSAFFAARAIAANHAVAKKSVRKPAPVLTPRADPFAPIASETHHSLQAPSGLVAVSNTGAKPAPVRQNPVPVAMVSPSLVAPASDTVAEVAPFAVVSAPSDETTAAVVAETTTSPAATKTLVAASVYANASLSHSPASANSSVALLDETARNVPSPSGANGAGAFSVTDAATKAQRQRALFSYSRP